MEMRTSLTHSDQGNDSQRWLLTLNSPPPIATLASNRQSRNRMPSKLREERLDRTEASEPHGLDDGERSNCENGKATTTSHRS